MENKDYFEICKDKEYIELLRDFGYTAERVKELRMSHSLRMNYSNIDEEEKKTERWYAAEIAAQDERVAFLFDYLKELPKETIKRLREAAERHSGDSDFKDAMEVAINIVLEQFKPPKEKRELTDEEWRALWATPGDEPVDQLKALYEY